MKSLISLALLIHSTAALATDPVAGPPKAWADAGFGHPEIITLRPPSSLNGRTFSHSVKILFVQFRRAGWSPEDDQKQFEWVAKSYAQCGVKFEASPLVVADAPGGKVSIDPNQDEVDDGAIARRIPVSHRPAVILLKRNISFPSGYSYNTVHPPKEQALIGTAFVDSTVLNSIIKLSYYNVIAHELAHILVNAGHNQNDPPDILSAPIPHADTINEEQCQQIQSYPTVKALN